MARNFAIFIEMGNLFQTSGFQIQEREADNLLRVFPLQISVGESPTIFFRIDSELQIGASVSYRLVSGFQIVQWKCIISMVKGSSWRAELKQGPFTAFSATHEQTASGNFLEYTDEIQFNGESPELANVLECAKIQYAFPSRQALLQAKNTFESRRKTESFRAFSSENLSAG